MEQEQRWALAGNVAVDASRGRVRDERLRCHGRTVPLDERVLTPSGTRRLYEVNPAGVGEIRTWVEGVWTTALAALSSGRATGGDDMTANTKAAFRTALTVRAPIDRAFTVFTAGFDTWWPRNHHIGRAELASVTMEGGVGGRWFERRADGSECDWGRVLTWDPPHRVTLSWQINSGWEYDAELTEAAIVDVRFVADGDRATRVEFEHTDLDRVGDAWEKVLRDVSSANGWSGILEAFAATFVG
jgi:uncharacterized protein YndB with AHSA1/START domain